MCGNEISSLLLLIKSVGSDDIGMSSNLIYKSTPRISFSALRGGWGALCGGDFLTNFE